VTARWALLVGRKGEGKSSAASWVAAELAARGVAVGGFVQEAIEEDDERVGYRARGLGRPDSVVVARRGSPPRGAEDGALLSFCSFVFDNDAFRQARGWLQGDLVEAGVVVIDEVSKLEVARGGHHDAILDALAGGAVVLLVVRADQLFSVVERFDLGEPVATLDAGDDDARAGFVSALAQAAREATP